MSLIKCPNCGKEYSEYAEKCPVCGLTIQEAEKSANRQSEKKRKNPWVSLLIILLSIGVAISAYYLMNNVASIPEGGMLPKGYEWAYGSWEVVEISENSGGWDYNDSTINNSIEYSVIIGSDYLQISHLSICRGLQAEYSDNFYPVYTLPHLKYEVEETENANEIRLVYCEVEGGYETYIYLNKKKKTVGASQVEFDKIKIKKYGDIEIDGKQYYYRYHFTKFESKKVKQDIDSVVICQYLNKLNNSPIWGEWKELNTTSRNIESYCPEENPEAILRKDGKIYLYGCLLEYHSDGDLLSEEYQFSETECKHTYRRYDAQAEEDERLTAMLGGCDFLNRLTLPNNTDVLQMISLYSNGEGDCSTGTENLWELKYNDHSPLTWTVVGGRLKTIMEGEECYFDIVKVDGTLCLQSDNIGKTLYEQQIHYD